MVTDVLDKIMDLCVEGMNSVSAMKPEAAQVTALNILGTVAGVAGGAKAMLKDGNQKEGE